MNQRKRRYTHQHTRDWSARVAGGEAFVFVMPEFNHGFNAELKNAIDYLHKEWEYKPVGLVGYGVVAASTRAMQMIKPVLATLRMTPVGEAVSIPLVQQFVDDDGFTPNGLLTGSAKSMLDELVRMTEVLRPLRAG
jgi:NAD(P)H-dependent FMN reductase